MKSQQDKSAGAIFLIGIGLLFVTGWWWPGILFVLAATNIAKVMSAGYHWSSARGALWLAAIGFIFMFKLSWGFIWIIIGFALLATYMMRRNDDDEKQKNDTFDDYI